MRYEDEIFWLTQKMMAVLYAVYIPASSTSLTVKLLPYFHKVGLDDILSNIAPRVSGTNMDYEQYPVIGRNPPKVTV